MANNSKDKQPSEKDKERINLVVRSNIRKAVAGKIDNVAEEVEEALNDKVHEMLEVAIERAKANQRRTIQARDL